MDLSAHLNNRIMAMVPSELNRLFVQAKAAPDFDKLQASFENQQKTLAAAYGDSDKPRLKNGAISALANSPAKSRISGSCWWRPMR